MDCFDHKSSTVDDLQFIKNNPVSLLMSYNVLNRTTFLYELIKAKKAKVIKQLLKTLEMIPSSEVPFMFPEVYVNG